jgi:exodeoxyribonuclease-3
VLNKGFLKFVDDNEPDVLLLQETKLSSDIDLNLPGYAKYWNHAKKAGYAGTAAFTRIKPLNVAYGIGIKRHDDEGRVITLEFDKFFLVNVYTPNSGRGGTPRLKYRQEWDRDFLKYMRRLEQKKPVVVCGDFNVAHKEMDLANPKQNVKNAGFTPEERAGFDEYIKAGFIDTFREFNKEPKQYSWWTYMFNARAKNVGWRIDYFLISKTLRPMLKEAFILQKVMGSDHCPVGIEIKG